MLAISKILSKASLKTSKDTSVVSRSIKIESSFYPHDVSK